MASPKKTIPELTAITIVNDEFLLVIFDGTSTKKITVSDFVKYIVEQNAASGGGTNPGASAPETPEDGKTTWIDTTNPESPSLKLFINGKWVDLTGSGAGDMLRETYDPQNKNQDIFKYVDDAIRAAIGELPSETISQFQSHTENNNIHVTSEDKDKWNTAAEHPSNQSLHLTTQQKSDLDAAVEHPNNDDVHVQTEDKTSWNAAYNHVSNTNVHIQTGEKEKWDAAYEHTTKNELHVSTTDKNNWNAKVTPEKLAQELAKVEPAVTGVGEGAGGHNGMYRGKNLGTSVTEAQWSAISSGAFTDLFIGDYWEIDNVKWRIAAFDYYLHTGGTEVTKHHVTVVPDSALYTAQMNTSATNANGYQGSAMFTTGLANAKTKVNSAFGSTHVLSHKMYFSNKAASGRVSGASEYDSTVDLMSEINVYGCRMFCAGSNGSTVPNLYSYDKSQYPLFKFRPDLIMEAGKQFYWLREIALGSSFSGVSSNGYCDYNNADSTNGVRPAVNLIGS